MYYILYRYKDDRGCYMLRKSIYTVKSQYDYDLSFVIGNKSYSVIKHGRTNEL